MIRQSPWALAPFDSIRHRLGPRGGPWPARPGQWIRGTAAERVALAVWTRTSLRAVLISRTWNDTEQEPRLLALTQDLEPPRWGDC